ncbi:MAG: SDR family oxidoreductase [Deltaproteobacteria bacterium]|jgi:NAD(P)-dependent dehydrogenase (short-subunit alcohol dehydrogenase family)|nr:SDR family oxidoreductase [Deltaproteobacteria bacterium]
MSRTTSTGHANELWTAEQMPDLSGKTAVVTGANSGIGLETARQLARKGARVVFACRSPEKAEIAIASVGVDAPGAALDLLPLDLASLESIEAFAKRCTEAHPSIDILCNNAGVMALPMRRTTDGFEMQLGTNHLGHFALTGRLLPSLIDTPGARIVTLSSTAHKMGRMSFDDLHWTRGYSKWRAYCQSKLANLLFAYELQRRLEASQKPILSVACHPGYAATNLQLAGPQMEGSSFVQGVMTWANRVIAQDASGGALPTLYAATSKQVVGAGYYGPSKFAEMSGPPKRVESAKRSHDREAATELWRRSEELTRVRFEGLAAA